MMEGLSTNRAWEWPSASVNDALEPAQKLEEKKEENEDIMSIPPLSWSYVIL